ncbi:MAG: DNA repair protein RecO [Leptonema sp. (in: bacteria)]
MKLQKGKGFIMRKTEVGEGDVILDTFLLDPESFYYSRRKLKIFGILKSKKRNPVVVEIGNYISVSYYYKEALEICNIKEIDLIERFNEIKKKYETFYSFSKLIQITNTVAVSDKDLEEIYKLFYFAIYFLENYLKTPNLEIQTILTSLNLNFWDLFFLFYVIRLLKIIGYVGDLNHCSNCNQPIIKKAKWQEKMYFFCSVCDFTANQIDFFYKQMILLILQNKFIDFLYKLKEIVDSTSEKNQEFYLSQFLEPMKKKINSILNDLLENPINLFF